MGRGRIILLLAMVVLIAGLMTGSFQPGEMTERRINFYDDWGPLPLIVIAGIGAAIAFWRR